MQVSKIMLAVAGLALSASAFAKPNVGEIGIISGASATRGNTSLALKQLCEDASGTFTSFGSGNIFTYVCANSAVAAGAGNTYATKAPGSFVKFAGTNFVEVRHNVSGGSFSAVCLLNNFAAGTACDVINGAGVPDKYFDPEANNANSLAPAGAVVLGGLLDVGPENWPESVTAGLTVPEASGTGVAQTFGLAVSAGLYQKLFDAQKSTGGATVSKPIPSTCLVTDTSKLECVPTVGKAQMSTIMANNPFNMAHQQGLQFLTGDVADAGVPLDYARRADTSGTQAAAQVYFLGTSCTPNQLTVFDVTAAGVANGGVYDGTADGSYVRVWNLSGTGDVRNVLKGSTPGAGTYAIGVVSGENTQSESWRWVRLNGAPLGENATPNLATTNSAPAKAGMYDFVFESKVAASSAAGAADFWAAVNGALGSLAAPKGLLNATDLAGFNKNGSACQNLSSN